MNILFINGSPNKNGNTAALAEELLRGKAYETLNLTDYTIGACLLYTSYHACPASHGAMVEDTNFVSGY